MDKNILTYIRNYRIPQNLDLEQLIQDKDVDPFWLTPRGLECLLFVVSYILRKYCEEEITLGHFVSISAKLMQQRFGKSPMVNGKRQYLNIPAICVLEQLEVITVNRKHSNGRFCMSYALKRKYCTTIYKTVSFSAQASPKSLIKAASKRYPLDTPEKQYFDSCLNQLAIDERRFAELMQNAGIPSGRKNRLDWAADDFRNRMWRIHSGRNQRRIYHILTKCPREFRKVVTLGGMPLVEADVKTCQPILLLSICPEEEQSRFREILRNDIYLSLGGINRGKAKKDFYNLIFKDYQEPGHETTWERFLQRANSSPFGRNFLKFFPRFSETIFKFPGLSRTMQDFEAEIIIYSILPVLMQNGIWAVSIHDSFIIRNRDFAFVEESLKAEFLKRFSFDVIVCQK